ncbi:hypothetical protein MRX96_049071 [Rhipicephalus microplus]
MTDYNDITKAYRMAHRTFPFLHAAGSSGGGTERAPDWITTEPGTDAPHVHPEAYQTDKCKVCWREMADHVLILWNCIKHPEEARSRTIQSWLEAAAQSYDQEEQLCAIQQVLEALERKGCSGRQRRAGTRAK